jgi:hypothetical protein
MSGIGKVEGGISLDTYNGRSVLAVYKVVNHYEVIEYIINV